MGMIGVRPLEIGEHEVRRRQQLRRRGEHLSGILAVHQDVAHQAEERRCVGHRVLGPQAGIGPVLGTSISRFI